RAPAADTWGGSGDDKGGKPLRCPSRTPLLEPFGPEGDEPPVDTRLRRHFAFLQGGQAGAERVQAPAPWRSSVSRCRMFWRGWIFAGVGEAGLTGSRPLRRHQTTTAPPTPSSPAQAYPLPRLLSSKQTRRVSASRSIPLIRAQQAASGAKYLSPG